MAYLAQGQSSGAAAGHRLHAVLREAPTAESLGRAAQGLMLSFLLASGGACRHPLVIDQGEGEAAIREVVLWDAADQVPLQLGPRASHLLQCLQDAFRQDIRLRLPGPDLSSGEPWLYHALYLRVADDARLRYFASALRRASPLTRLCSCPIVDEHPLVPCAEGIQGRAALSREESEGLLGHPAMMFLRGYLADQWSTIEAPTTSSPYDMQLARLSARYATLAQCLERCVNMGKIAMLSVFPLFFQRLLQRHFVAKARATMQLSHWRIAEREAMLRGYIGLLALSDAFEDQFQRVVVQPGAYGWQHPQQTRIFVRTYGRLWTSGGLGAQIQEARRQLRGLMG